MYSNAADSNAESGSPELITTLSKQHSGKEKEYRYTTSDIISRYNNDTMNIYIHQRYDTRNSSGKGKITSAADRISLIECSNP